MKAWLGISCLLLTSFVFSQSTISGTLYAAEVNGLVVIACYADAVTGCNEGSSAYIQITTPGPSANYQLTNLSAGQYVVFLWRDTNASGYLEEDQDDVAYYTDTSGQPLLVQPPASGIDLRLAAVNPLSQTPHTLTSPAPSKDALVGAWYQGSVSGVTYYSPSTGSWAPPSGSGFRYIFKPDGSYEYSGLMQSSLYNCTMSIFGYETGTYILQDGVLVLTPHVNKLKSDDNCNAEFNYEKDVPLETEYQLVRWGQDEYTGEVTLELTALRLNAQGQLEVDPEYAASGPSVFRREK